MDLHQQNHWHNWRKKWVGRLLLEGIGLVRGLSVRSTPSHNLPALFLPLPAQFCPSPPHSTLSTASRGPFGSVRAGGKAECCSTWHSTGVHFMTIFTRGSVRLGHKASATNCEENTTEWQQIASFYRFTAKSGGGGHVSIWKIHYYDFLPPIRKYFRPALP